MLGIMNPYLKKIGFPKEIGYFGSLYFYYEFPNGINMILLDTYGPLSLYTFQYGLFTKDNRPIIVRDDQEIYLQASLNIEDPEKFDAFLRRIMRLGIDEKIDFYTNGTLEDYKLENQQKMLDFMPWDD